MRRCWKPPQGCKAVGGQGARGWHPKERRLHAAHLKVFQGFSQPWCRQRGFDELKKASPCSLKSVYLLQPRRRGKSVNIPYKLQGKEGTGRHAEPRAWFTPIDGNKISLPLIASFPHLYPTHPLAFLALIPLIVDPFHQSLRRQRAPQHTKFLPARMKIYIKRHVETWTRTAAKQRVPRDAGHVRQTRRGWYKKGGGVENHWVFHSCPPLPTIPAFHRKQFQRSFNDT